METYRQTVIRRESRRLPILLPLATSLFFQGIGGLAEAAGPESDLDGWALGNFLLVGILVLLVVGWFAGAYALLFAEFLAKIASPVKRVFLYPLLKVIGKRGDKKPLTTGKR